MKHCGLIVSVGSGLFHGNRPRAEAVKTLAAETTFMRGSGARADACRVGFAGIASRGPRLLAKRPLNSGRLPATESDPAAQEW